MKVGILEVGISNIASVYRMIEKVGGVAEYISTSDQIYNADKIIIPGVGHFDKGMKSLYKNGIVEALYQRITVDKIPVMGICLGMQLLCNESEEGKEKGLSLIDADVKKFRFDSDKKLKIPHMGWNIVHSVRDNDLIPYMTNDEYRYYFVHSYHVVPNDPNLTIGIANYGGEFCAAIQSDNIYGVQFHAEKSHRFGMELMKKFIDI